MATVPDNKAFILADMSKINIMATQKAKFIATTAQLDDIEH